LRISTDFYLEKLFGYPTYFPLNSYLLNKWP
jgi:hypothetical protein